MEGETATASIYFERPAALRLLTVPYADNTGAGVICFGGSSAMTLASCCLSDLELEL